MTPSFCVIADDLTGALDTGVMFRKNGFLTTVSSRRLLDTRSGIGNPDVLVVNTETRHLEPEQAYGLVSSLAKAIVKLSPAPVVYKKIDSTLRGNIGPELRALGDAFPGRLQVIAPALPAQGRTCRNGSVYLHGKPLHETEFGKDPCNPVRTSFVPDLLFPDMGSRGAVLSPVELEALLSKEAGANYPGKIAFAVINGETEEDLRRTAQSCLGYSSRVIPTGSAGLAAWLSSLSGKPAGSASGSGTSFELPAGPALVVNGSLNPVALVQIRNAIQEGARDFAVGGKDAALFLEMGKKVGNKLREAGSGFGELVGSIGTSLAKGDSVCIRTILDPGQLSGWLNDFSSIGENDLPMNIALPQALGCLVARVFETVRPAFLVVLGGDTLTGILDALESETLYPEAELAPGIVASRVGNSPGSMILVSKAGGFGDPKLLVRLLGNEL